MSLQTAGSDMMSPRRNAPSRFSGRETFEQNRARPGTTSIEQRRLRDLLWPSTQVVGQETRAIHAISDNGIYSSKVFDSPQVQIVGGVGPANPLDSNNPRRFTSNRTLHAERRKHTRRGVLKNDYEPLAKPGEFPHGQDIGSGVWKQAAIPSTPRSYPMDFTANNPRAQTAITSHQWDMKAKGVNNMLRSSQQFQVSRAGGGWNTRSSNAPF